MWAKITVTWKPHWSWRAHWQRLSDVTFGKMPQFLAGYWLQACFPSLEPSRGIHMTWQLISPKASNVRENEQEESPNVSYDLPWKVTHYDLCFILFIRSKSLIPLTLNTGRFRLHFLCESYQWLYAHTVKHHRLCSFLKDHSILKSLRVTVYKQQMKPGANSPGS